MECTKVPNFYFFLKALPLFCFHSGSRFLFKLSNQIFLGTAFQTPNCLVAEASRCRRHSHGTIKMRLIYTWNQVTVPPSSFFNEIILSAQYCPAVKPRYIPVSVSKRRAGELTAKQLRKCLLGTLFSPNCALLPPWRTCDSLASASCTLTKHFNAYLLRIHSYTHVVHTARPAVHSFWVWCFGT